MRESSRLEHRRLELRLARSDAELEELGVEAASREVVGSATSTGVRYWNRAR